MLLRKAKMFPFEFRTVIVCDDVRREISQKDILIGVYPSEIVIAALPGPFTAAFWMEVYSNQIGQHEIDFRLHITGKPFLTIKIKAQILQEGTFAIAIPTLQIMATEECDIVLEYQDGEEWKELKRKKVIVGNVPTIFSSAPPQPS
jgi:hypothetical protein